MHEGGAGRGQGGRRCTRAEPDRVRPHASEIRASAVNPEVKGHAERERVVTPLNTTGGVLETRVSSPPR